MNRGCVKKREGYEGNSDAFLDEAYVSLKD